MYYDPMISKLITWGKDRKTALDLINQKFDEYVVHGVAHNIGFGKSIVENDAFLRGEYSTAFIPTYYPEGYHGDKLTVGNKQTIALAAFQMKNTSLKQNLVGSASARTENVLYVSIAGEDKDYDFRVEKTSKGFTVTDLETKQAQDLSLNGFTYEHNSLIEVIESGSSTKLQLLSQSNDLSYDFYFRGNKVKTHVYDEA